MSGDLEDRWHVELDRVWHRAPTGNTNTNTNTNSSGGRVARRLPIVLLHEGLGSIAAWGDFPARLAAEADRDVLVYDRIGYGQSPPGPGPWPADFMHREAVALDLLMKQEHIDQAFLVGHSDGASIALLYPSQTAIGPTGRSGVEVAGIVSLSAHVFVEPDGVVAIEGLRDSYRQTIATPLARYHRDADATFDAWSEVWLSDRFRTWTIDDELAAVECPVVAVQGAADGYGTDEQVHRVAAAVSGPAEVVLLPQVDHWPHKEAPEDVIAIIGTFCDRIDP